MAKKIKKGLLKIWIKILTIILSMLGITINVTACMYSPEDPEMYSPQNVEMYSQPFDEGKYTVTGTVKYQSEENQSDLIVYVQEKNKDDILSEEEVAADGSFTLLFYDNSDFTEKIYVITVKNKDGVEKGSFELNVTKNTFDYKDVEIILK